MKKKQDREKKGRSAHSEKKEGKKDEKPKIRGPKYDIQSLTDSYGLKKKMIASQLTFVLMAKAAGLLVTFHKAAWLSEAVKVVDSDGYSLFLKVAFVPKKKTMKTKKVKEEV